LTIEATNPKASKRTEMLEVSSSAYKMPVSIFWMEENCFTIAPLLYKPVFVIFVSGRRNIQSDWLRVKQRSIAMIGRIISDLLIWSSLLLLCSLILFIEAVGIFRALLAMRQARWRFFLVLIPLTACIWSFTIAVKELSVQESFYRPYAHMSLAFYSELLSNGSMAIENCQLQVGIVAGIFILSLFLEKVFRMQYIPFMRHAGKDGIGY